MKDTIFEPKETSTRENITYHFQPNQHLDAIKSAIVKRYKEKVPHVEESQLQQHHVGGLPSPPVEEKKVMPTPIIKKEPLISSSELKEKIQSLKEEKHRLFQLIKQMMVEEESKRRELQKTKAAQVTKPLTTNKKKSRWAPCSTDTLPYYNNASYFYPRPPLPPMPRFNSNHPYSNVSYYSNTWIYTMILTLFCYGSSQDQDSSSSSSSSITL
jgi:hypothetical protein